MKSWELGIDALASAYTKGDLRPSEVVDDLLRHIEDIDPEIGAFRQLLADSAMVAAGHADERLRDERRPLEGIPVAVKELFDVAGANGAYGSQVLAGRISDRDAEAVSRLRAAGAIVIGTTRSHEFGWGITTQHATLGSTANPWDESRVPGGSSGGSAAAVASGMVPLALGSDTGGSIRIPAAYCGVVGLKPTYGRISKRGVVPLAPSLDHPGPIARSVADSVAALAVLQGRDPGDPSTRLEVMNPVRSRLRVGVCQDLHLVNLSDDYEQLFRSAIESLVRTGIDVIEVRFPLAPDIQSAFASIQMAEAYHFHSDILGAFPARSALYGSDVRQRLEMAAEVSLREYLEAVHLATAVRRAFEELFLTEVDVLVTPIAAAGPSRRSQPDRADHHGETMAFRDLVMGYTVPQNLAGLPAIAVPVGFDSDQIPVGLQVTAGAHDEMTAAAVADMIAVDIGRPIQR